MFGKACKQITVSFILFPIISLFFYISILSAQDRRDNQDFVVANVVSVEPPYTFKATKFVLEKGINVRLIDRQHKSRYLKKDLDYSYNEDTGIITFNELLYDDFKSGDICVSERLP